VDFEARMGPVVWNGKIIYNTFDNTIYLSDPVKLENKLLWKLPDVDNISGPKLILLENILWFQNSNF